MTARPSYFSYTLDTVATTFFATGLTGAGPFLAASLTKSATVDTLAHLLTLTSAANLSGSNITILGTDADGVSQSEVIAGPNVNTVTTTKFFKTIVSLTASVSLGANTMDVGLAAGSVGPTVPLESYLEGQTVNAQVTAGGTINFDIADTMSDIRGDPNSRQLQSAMTWLNDANFTAKTASLSAPLAVVARAVRLEINSYNAGATAALALITPR